MSDFGRKSFTDKASETLKPDSQKSYAEQAKEKASDLYDEAAKRLQPEENKGVSQTAGDVASGAKSDVKDAANAVHGESKDEGSGLLKKAEELAEQYHASEYLQQGKESAKSYLNEAGKYVNQASEYIQSKTGGAAK